MKKKVLSVLLAVTMLAGTLVACGSEPSNGGVSTTEEGKVLNIYCWNNEFRERVVNLYPGYTKTDETHGTIGDVSVVWHETPNEGNAYQNNLDETLLKQESAAADDKIDMFLTMR